MSPYKLLLALLAVAPLACSADWSAITSDEASLALRDGLTQEAHFNPLIQK